MTPETIMLTGTVRKVIDRSRFQELPQAQIAVADAAYLYSELRISNTQGWEEGKAVEVTIRLV
jgi:hypothetical protein